MIVTAENLIHYLIERGFVTRDSVVNGSVEISDIPRRNCNFRITQRGGQGYFLKQARQWDTENIRTLRTEAECYKLAAGDSGFCAITEIVPHFRLYDQRNSILITELLEGTETIAEHHFKNGRFPIDVAEQLGRVFGAYHVHATENPPATLDGVFLRRPPWVLSIHEMPSEATASLSGGVHQLLAMIRQFPQFRAALENLRSNWRHETLMHGDIRWENCILCPGSNDVPSLKIVDWELADWGDSCWDVAGIMSAYLSFWVQSLPATASDPNAMVAKARYPVERMQPAMQAFWRTYISCRDVSGELARGLLRRSMLYTGARMIQTALEALQMSSSANSGTVCSLQLSMNVLEDPEEATRELLGIEP